MDHGSSRKRPKGMKEWIRKYYPIPAQHVARMDAAAHSLQKWLGLRKKVIDRYDLEMCGLTLEDNSLEVVLQGEVREGVAIDSSSCALCVHHLEPDGIHHCTTCPLAIVRGGVPCTRKMEGEWNSPWGAWVEEADPELMIRWLRRTADWVKKKQKARTKARRIK